MSLLKPSATRDELNSSIILILVLLLFWVCITMLFLEMLEKRVKVLEKLTDTKQVMDYEWPQTIMDTGNVEYVMYEPGGEIVKHEKLCKLYWQAG
jgi:hypothetical protein